MLLEETATVSPSGTGILKNSGSVAQILSSKNHRRTPKQYPSLNETPVVKAGRVFSKIIFKANFGYWMVNRVWGGFAHTPVNGKVVIVQQLPDLLQGE